MLSKGGEEPDGGQKVDSLYGSLYVWCVCLDDLLLNVVGHSTETMKLADSPLSQANSVGDCDIRAKILYLCGVLRSVWGVFKGWDEVGGAFMLMTIEISVTLVM